MRQFVLEGFLHLFFMTSGKGFEKCSNELAVHVQDTHGPEKKNVLCIMRAGARTTFAQNSPLSTAKLKGGEEKKLLRTCMSTPLLARPPLRTS